MPFRIFIDSKKHWVWHVVFAWSYPDNTIIPESNYWAYILPYKSCAAAQTKTNEIFQRIKNDIPCEKIDYPCVFGVSPFYAGTGHGYCFIFQLIDQYRDSDKKILMVETAQKGMLELCERVFGNERIIRIKSNTTYEISDLCFVNAKHHTFVPHTMMCRIMPFFICKTQSLSLCILKTTTTENTTNNGVLNQSQIQNLNIPERFTMIDPSSYNECEYASMIYYSNEILISWGTAFAKAAAYLIEGTNCKKVSVLVVGRQFEQEFNVGKGASFKNVIRVPDIDFYVWNDDLLLKDM